MSRTIQIFLSGDGLPPKRHMGTFLSRKGFNFIAPSEEAQMSDAQRNPPNTMAAYDRLEKDITVVKSDIATLSQQITDAIRSLADLAQKQTKRGLRNARDNVDSVLSDASERAGSVAGTAREKAATIGDTLEEAIHERPLTTTAITLLLGFLIGVIWRR
jgi:ElaB/YqjD/DUF883 family membrane-anchored ribosome-binding protein